MLDRVITGGYCIGCGACAAIQPEDYRIELDGSGRFQAAVQLHRSFASQSPAATVCPFSELSKNEDELAARFLPDAAIAHRRIGYHIECYVGRVADHAVYHKGSSGGIGRWLLAELLARGEVDHIIHVTEYRPEGANFPLYRYSIATSVDEIMTGGKSAYYPVEMSEVLRFAMLNSGKYAITGVPCFIKAVRNLCLLNRELEQRIKFTIGLVCGHLKSSLYAEMIGWQLGVRPKELRGIDFRVKVPGRRANEKGVSAISPTAISPTARRAASSPKTVQQLFGTNYGYGYFKYEACDYCDDVLAETADVSIGDAWLPEYLGEGTSIIVARHRRIREIIDEGMARSHLVLDTISAGRVAESQNGGLRHRREGLAYRLYLKRKEGKWVPTKRVEPSTELLNAKQRKIQRLRLRLARESFIHFKVARDREDWNFFYRKMKRLNNAYARAYRQPVKGSLPFRLLAGIWRRLMLLSK